MSKKSKKSEPDTTVKIVRSYDELKAVVGEETAKELKGSIDRLAASDRKKVQCRIVIEFEAPDAQVGRAACVFFQQISKETIEASNWGQGSFQSVVMDPTVDGDEDEPDEEPETKRESKPVSPLN